MNLKYHEKLIIAIIIFIGVAIIAGFSIGYYSHVKNKNNEDKNKDNNSIILENINLF